MTPDELRAPKVVKAWHFVSKDRRLGYGDNRKVEAGWTYYDDCKTPVLCNVGLHACRNILDALSYAPGPVCCRVEIAGVIVEGDDKLVGTERTVLAVVDATDVLRKFTRLCALGVAHLWSAPDIVVRWLKTGDESLRSAAYSAAYSDADAAADTAARSAAYSAATIGPAYSVEYAALRSAYWAVRSAAYSAAYSAVRKKQAARLAGMMNRLLKGNDL